MILVVNVETNIRRMKVDDLPQVLGIDQNSFSSPWTLSAFRFELLENPNSHCWVAEIESVLVGFIICWLIIDEIHIATIAVHPKYRNRGISKEMIMTGLSELISKGGLKATLEVRAGNTPAQRLYRYFGFIKVGIRKGYYQDTHEDAILMTAEPLDLTYLVWLNSGARKPWINNDS
jgi:ribosomal-protein-alanine N-acetyltransferase